MTLAYLIWTQGVLLSLVVRALVAFLSILELGQRALQGSLPRRERMDRCGVFDE